MKNPNWLSLAVICLVVIGFLTYVFWSKSSDNSTSIFSLEPTPTMSSNEKTPLYTPTPDIAATATPSAAASTPAAIENPGAPTANSDLDQKSQQKTPQKTSEKSVVQQMPKMSAIRDEVKKNPHETPGSAIQFAMMIGEREKTAIENEQDSKNLMTELEACGLTKDPELKYPSVQVICLSTARELSEKWPSLKGRYNLLMKTADPKAVGLEKEMN